MADAPLEGQGEGQGEEPGGGQDGPRQDDCDIWPDPYDRYALDACQTPPSSDPEARARFNRQRRRRGKRRKGKA